MATPVSPFQQATRIRLSPTDPLFRQCKDLAILPRRQAIPSGEARSTKKGRTRSKHRRTRSLLATWRDVNSQTRSRKRWRIVRRSPPTVTSDDQPPGHPDTSHNGRGRSDWQTSSLLGTPKVILLSSSHFRILFCNCWVKSGSGKLGRRHRKASGERRYISCQSKGTKREKRVKKEIDDPHNNPSQPDSNHAPKQQIRNYLPHEGGHPRCIADGLQLGTRGRIPNGHGDQNARQRSQKSSQNTNRTNPGGKSDLQTSTRMREVSLPSNIHLNHAPHAKLLPDPLRE